MPELPEVETVRRGLRQSVEGDRFAEIILRRGDIRIPIPPDLPLRLEGCRITSIERRAKYLLFYIEGGDVLIIHLGMSGRIMVREGMPNQFQPHDHVIFRLQSGRVMIFNDPRRFGLVTLCHQKSLADHSLFRHLGPEPMDEGSFTADYLYKACRNRQQAIKPFIMDQQIVVGVGNIYASEALFDAGINPERSASKLTKKQCRQLVGSIRKVLECAIAAGGSSLRDYVDSRGEAGYFQHCFLVYNRAGKPCLRCGGKIAKITQAGRASFYCENCQK